MLEWHGVVVPLHSPPSNAAFVCGACKNKPWKQQVADAKKDAKKQKSSESKMNPLQVLAAASTTTIPATLTRKRSRQPTTTECHHPGKRSCIRPFLHTIQVFDAAIANLDDFLRTEDFLSKQLVSVAFSERGFLETKSRPYFAHDVPILYDHKSLPSVTTLLQDFREAVGGGKMVISNEYGKEKLTTAAVFDLWAASARRILLKHELVNAAFCVVPEFVQRFQFPSVDKYNRLTKKTTDRRINFSARGTLTGTHDDPYDALTYYFAGVKLWFMFSAQEAEEAKIPNLANDTDCVESAAFLLRDFVRLKSAWWAVVGAGQFLSVPAGMLHRVLTLESSFGITYNFSVV